MNVWSRLSSVFVTVTSLLAVLAAPPLFGGTLEPIFDHDFENGTYVGWSDKVPAECDDLIRNGDETDVDCGGLTCSGCAQGQSCLQANDCADQAGWSTAYAVCEELACSMGCMGENYDVDGSDANGCEAVDQPLGNHTQETAINLGSFPCNDASVVQFVGKIPSDSREHGFPGVGGFDAIAGAAPDHLRLFGDGGIACSNDISLVLTTGGGSAVGTCYRLTVSTSENSLSCNVSGSGNCLVSCGAACYGEDTDIFFKVEKTCSLPLIESVSYNVSGHL